MAKGEVECLTVSISDAAKMVGIGECGMRQIAKTDRTFPAFGSGRTIRVWKEGLVEWLKARAQNRVGIKGRESEVAAIINMRRAEGKLPRCKNRKERGVEK